jgi:hypothetical protein
MENRKFFHGLVLSDVDVFVIQNPGFWISGIFLAEAGAIEVTAPEPNPHCWPPGVLALTLEGVTKDLGVTVLADLGSVIDYSRHNRP